jgi:hypothetical protein
MSGRVIDQRGPKGKKKKIEVRQIDMKGRRGSVNPEDQGKSPFSP